MTILKEFFGLLWTIAVVAFLIGFALGVYVGFRAGVAMHDARDTAALFADVWTGGGGRV